ncbi:hypothetical protein [Gloeobacter kilaueensis]|uniref:Uncharacterized protein n=1 Tax=Gloeobacter kilaueensis (strain ATCC BAA-2537 / CCAP 1431/1 / ULC 316 / JS1) TaxID=1183438 RepID=U5QD80_GLOK1|nr:hypothetical protein [Gloeobacter kilaueensis]AGY56872.1 hypothetical protein GKIL_0626 [Gloeobacter kilaueensis JS1]
MLQRRHLRNLLVFTLLLIGALALPARADVWQGNGQVVSGPGAGATVSLTVNYDGETLKTISGPTLEGSQVRVDQQGDFLELTLFRGNQVVKYRLRRLNPGDNHRTNFGARLDARGV